jgi:2-amino-4-hydroxy-6-hydroxymethyldihydropteridine diphosphokinase
MGVPRYDAFIGLGANQGNNLTTLRSAAAQLRDDPECRGMWASGLYRTAPVGGPAEQPDYTNAVVQVHTTRSPQDLLSLCLEIERVHGRAREVHHGPRTLDLDILFHGNTCFASAGLTLPHPRLHERMFVLVPLADVAPDLLHPLLSRSIQRLHDELAARTTQRVSCIAGPEWLGANVARAAPPSTISQSRT